MFGLGTLVNTGAIIAGSLAGVIIKKGIPERFKNIITQATALSVVMIGVSGALQGLYVINKNGTLDRQYIMVMVFSLIAGSVIGELINIEKWLESFADLLHKRMHNEGAGFTKGFVNASLVFCVGAMAIVGALEDGLSGNTSTLYSKSILDGVTSLIFASTMGIGVLFSAGAVFLYQGSITLLSGLLRPFLIETVTSQMSLAGSVLIAAVGFNMLGMTKIKVGNMLPAIFLPLIYYIIRMILPIN